MRITSSKIEDIPEEDEKQDFDDMMSEVQEEIEEHDAEDAVVSRAPELRQLSENIDKATNTWINATLQLESAIRKYNSAQTALGNAVDTISGTSTRVVCNTGVSHTSHCSGERSSLQLVSGIRAVSVYSVSM